MYFLGLCLVMFSILSLFYYLRLIKLLCFDAEDSPVFIETLRPSLALIQSGLIFFVVFFGLAGSPLILAIHRLVLGLFL